jgi:hypothetical protein
MENLLLASTAIDLLAVAVLAWLVWRSGHEHDAALGTQQAALDSLRVDLTQLVQSAEQRTQVLDETIATRTQELRALLRDLDRAESARRPASMGDARREGPDVAEAARRLGADPAEARLLRDLQVSFAARRA